MRVALLFGGRSGEHEVSVMSARSVFGALLRGGFEVVCIGITREGRWVLIEEPEDFFRQESVEKGCGEVTLDLGPSCYILPDPLSPGIWVNGISPRGYRGARAIRGTSIEVDVVFPVLHGTFGEDGTLQGLLELSGIPYVGSDTLASAICMDKHTTKMVLSKQGIPVVPAIAVERWRWQTRRQEVLDEVCSGLDFPVFVKPSGSGSSLGVSKVKDMTGLPLALDEAFLYDLKALIEPAQEGALEVECSVLGNERPEASVPGQIVPSREFYDYEAKYFDKSTRLVIPAPLESSLAEKVRRVAVDAFRAAGCSGLARVDFFVFPDTGEIFVNEINTLPGFTEVSMYPKLWEASGLPYPQLVARLVDLALERKRTGYKHVRRVEASSNG